MKEMSTVSVIQDKIVVILSNYRVGLARKDLFRAVGDVDLAKDETLENQLRLAITALSIRGIVESLPGGMIKLKEVSDGDSHNLF